MLVQSVVSLALLCSTPHFLSAQLVPRSANTLAYFSHIADGGGWQTTFTVSNPNRNLVFGEISFRDSEGQNLYLDLEGHDHSGSVEFWIPAFGTVEFTSSATGPDVRVGWATLRASNSIQGVATYSAEAPDIRSAFPLRSLRFATSRRRRPTSGLPWATSTPLRCPSASGPHPTTGPRLTET